MKRWLLPLLLVASGLAILFAPIPFVLQEQVLCFPCDPNFPRSQCPKCPQKGDIEWKPSLFQMLLGKLSKSDSQGEMELFPITSTAPVNPISNRKTSCEQADGRWLESYQECEGIQKSTCDILGGKFNECDSPCRHEPTADKCITLCVAVCKFP